MRARLKLWTQERQPDRQATRSHGNSKWRARGEEVEKQRRGKEMREAVKTTVLKDFFLKRV